MKKNLRIVSAAAAALLAVAPVAAGVVPAANTVVSAATNATKSSASFATGNSVAVDNGKVSLGSLSYTGDTTNATLTNKLNEAIQKLLGSKDVSVANVHYDSATKQVTFEVVAPGSWNKGIINVNNVKLVGAQWTTSTTDGNKTTATTNGDTNTVLSFSATVIATPSASTPAAKPSDTGSTSINAGASSIFRADANTAVNVSAVAKTKVAPSTVTGNIVATLGNTPITATLHNLTDGNNAHVYTYNKGKAVNARNLTAGHYWLAFDKVTVNAGASYANKTETFTLSKGTFSSITATTPHSTNQGASLKVTADANGVFNLGPVLVDFYAYNSNDMKEVHFYDALTGNVVTSGTATMHAVNGKLNVNAVYNTLAGKYVASQLLNGQGIDQLLPVNDLRDQLKKQNITVDPNGYFTAPASFSVNFNAKSNDNGATASLPVTVNVDNVTPTAANESTTTKTIMHIATIYDKNGVATHEPVLRAYNSVEVVAEPVTLKDSKGKDAGKFYKLAGKDQYIKVGNIDGTSRTLKKNAVIYKSTGKPYMKSKKHRKIVKAGSTHTTYGKSFMIAGHQMYRVGRNQYIKKANF